MTATSSMMDRLIGANSRSIRPLSTSHLSKQKSVLDTLSRLQYWASSRRERILGLLPIGLQA